VAAAVAVVVEAESARPHQDRRQPLHHPVVREVIRGAADLRPPAGRVAAVPVAAEEHPRPAAAAAAVAGLAAE
jgi:hypothetical protein